MGSINDKEQANSLTQEAANLGKLLEAKIISGAVSLEDARKLLGLVDVASVPDTTKTETAVKKLLESADKKEEAEVLAEIIKEAALSLYAHMTAYDGCGYNQIDDGRILNKSIGIDVGLKSCSPRDSTLHMADAPFGYAFEGTNKIAIGKATVRRRVGRDSIEEVSSYKDVVGPGSTNQEPIYFMAAILDSFAKKGDGRGAIMHLFLLLPKSAAERLYACLHRNPAFIYEVCRDLICDRFPDCKAGWDEHENIGTPIKAKHLIIMGPSDIETLKKKHPTVGTHIPLDRSEFEGFAHEIK